MNIFRVIKELLEKFKKPQDPVKILSKDLMDKVFGHLQAEDILRCSLVSLDWNKCIAKSSKCMSKIRICICEPYSGLMWKFTPKDAFAMSNGGRCYKHISMLITRNMTRDHLLVLASHQWSSLTLCHHTFKSEIELINFFGLLEPFIEDLDLRHIKIINSKEKQIGKTNFVFPKLRKLKMSHCYVYIFSEIFRKVDQLEELSIETGPLPLYDDSKESHTEKVKAIQLLLVNNTRVRKLSLFLHQKDFDSMFMNQRFLARLRFQLDSLKVRKFRKLIDHDTNIVQVNNFENFLCAQQRTLRQLHLMEWMGNDIIQSIMNNLDRLKKLVIADLDCYGMVNDSIAHISLYRNESIETLKLFAKNLTCDKLQKTILRNVPNLKHLAVSTLNQQLLEFVCSETPKIVSLETNFFVAYIPPEREVLEKLRYMKINHSFGKNFKDMLRDFDSYTNFEAVFLQATEALHEQELMV